MLEECEEYAYPTQDLEDPQASLAEALHLRQRGAVGGAAGRTRGAGGAHADVLVAHDRVAVALPSLVTVSIRPLCVELATSLVYTYAEVGQPLHLSIVIGSLVEEALVIITRVVEQLSSMRLACEDHAVVVRCESILQLLALVVGFAAAARSRLLACVATANGVRGEGVPVAFALHASREGGITLLVLCTMSACAPKASRLRGLGEEHGGLTSRPKVLSTALAVIALGLRFGEACALGGRGDVGGRMRRACVALRRLGLVACVALAQDGVGSVGIRHLCGVVV